MPTQIQASFDIQYVPWLHKQHSHINSGSLKRKCCHFDEIFITGCIGSCQNDNFQCSQWRKFRPCKKKTTVLDGFFPYLAQMITSMRGCVACNDLWPWPISSRSFGLDLENRVCSVASTVLDGFFPYLIQMITSMRRCVACDDLWPWPISARSFDLDFENRVRSVMLSVLDQLFLIWHK